MGYHEWKLEMRLEAWPSSMANSQCRNGSGEVLRDGGVRRKGREDVLMDCINIDHGASLEYGTE